MAAVRLMLMLLALGTQGHAAPSVAAVPEVPAVAPTAPPPKAAKHKPKRNSDIADHVYNNIIFSKFAALVQAADLGTFLSSRGPFTVFVPTNSAFSRLPPGMFEDLLRPENKTQVQRVVLFHLLNGKAWFSSDIRLQKSIVSSEGNPLPIKTTKAGTLFVDKARVLRADEHCTNGMLDEIDTLLIPPKLVIVAAPPPDATTNAADTNATATDTNASPAAAQVPAKAPALPATPSIQ